MRTKPNVTGGYLNGLPTSVHDQVDVERWNASLYEACVRKKGGLIVDAFSGGGRDISKIYEHLGGKGRFLAIDKDPRRLQDMAAKPSFAIVTDQSSLQDVFDSGRIAALEASFPQEPFAVDLTGQASFVLCCAGLMFVPPDELDAVLKQLASFLAPGGEMSLRFSQERADQKENVNRSYFIHNVETAQAILEKGGLIVTRHPDLPDAMGRDFSWVDLWAQRAEQLSRPFSFP